MNDKVVFIFDKPNECCECPCFDESDYCKAMDESAPSEGIRNDCPLIPLPRRLDYHDLNWYNVDNIEGWNDCLDEILRKS